MIWDGVLEYQAQCPLGGLTWVCRMFQATALQPSIGTGSPCQDLPSADGLWESIGVAIEPRQRLMREIVDYNEGRASCTTTAR